MKKIVISVITITFLSSCGAKHDAKSLVKDYCKCKSNATGLKEKANCLKQANEDFQKAIKKVSAEEVDAFTKGFKEGLKSCD